MAEQVHGSQPSPPRDRTVRMQRIRIGLTGLAAVLLLIALTSAIFGSLDAPQGNPANQLGGAQGANSTGDEPLADLGVAPGAPSNDNDAEKAMFDQKAGNAQR